MSKTAHSESFSNGQPHLHRLTEREQEVLLLAAQGFKTKQIAACLFISENTVKFHRKNILVKLEAKTMAEAVALWK